VLDDDSDYDADAAYALALTPPDRPAAATEISIRIDDGADIVIDMASLTAGRLRAYLTVDQAEELVAGLSEILRIPSDATGSIDASFANRSEP
jgi:hypothetical protein